MTFQLKGKMGDTLRSQTVSTQLQQIAQQAREHPDRVFTTLAHLMDEEFLREAFRRTRKNGAPGADGVTARDYEANLTENLRNLHERLRSGRYKAPPVKRAWIKKEDGSQRPIGIPEFEDKIVQRAVVMLLSALYEQDFHPFSHGFREGHNPHQALHELREACRTLHIRWIVDADVSKCFDTLGHRHLIDIVRERVNDGAILRLIGKWLHAGVLEGDLISYPEKGAPQGGVASPVLANIYLHHVLDEWYVKEVRPRLKGRSFLIRFADDFVIGCEWEEDARRIMDVLPKRFDRFGLTIHPTKTTLAPFGKPDSQKTDQECATFDFLGFTHYWAKSRDGYWVIKRRTAQKRAHRAKKTLWNWCRHNRHTPVREQHRMLCSKLRGYYQYYGIRGNFQQMESVYKSVRKAWRFWLNRRTHKGKMTWETFKEWLQQYALPQPKIVHNI